MRLRPFAGWGSKADPSGCRRRGRQGWRTIVATLCIWVGAVAPLDWPKGSTWPLERASQRHVHTDYLAPLALGGRVESAKGPCPLTDGGIEALA